MIWIENIFRPSKCGYSLFCLKIYRDMKEEQHMFQRYDVSNEKGMVNKPFKTQAGTNKI